MHRPKLGLMPLLDPRRFIRHRGYEVSSVRDPYGGITRVLYACFTEIRSLKPGVCFNRSRYESSPLSCKDVR